ncbi:MAG: 6-phosphogluconolactonase, partial [Microbacteriaceae bacterium]
MPERVIETYVDAGELAAAVGARLIGVITSAVAQRGHAAIVLTGGTVGIALLRHVADYAPDVEWAKVQLFWGDERFVPCEDPDRNYRQAREALLETISIPSSNVHEMAASDGEFGDSIDTAAAAYEKLLPEEFDVHLLGMGGEGHI